MSNGHIGVAISTTGDEHRLGFLETCVKAWRAALPLGATIVVTVDGTPEAAERVRQIVDAPDKHVGGNIILVGCGILRPPMMGRMGVAVNKNTGIEYLMDAGVEHLFLCDDDTWPLYPQSLTKHTDLEEPHSMVCWGQSRLKRTEMDRAEWLWPRGVLLYVRRDVVETVGGMVEEFGVGGHEHAEWSQRIHNAGFTPAPFVTPASYATRTGKGAGALWHCEDMRKPDETQAQLGARRKAITTIRSSDRDWYQIDKVMARQEGSSAFVSYRAHENGRASATLCTNTAYQEACAVEPATPRSEK